MAAPIIHETQFPPDISEGAVGGPAYNTTVVITASGKEQRIQRWSAARQMWDVSQGVRTVAQGDVLIAFYHAREGRTYGFRFKDWSDFEVPAASPIDTVLITSTTFQLVKRYSSGGIEKIRNIYKPVTGTIKVYDQGDVEVVSGWSIDVTTGIITYGSAPAYLPKWSGEFDWPVRFNTDHMRMTYTHAYQRDWDAVPIIELRA